MICLVPVTQHHYPDVDLRGELNSIFFLLLLNNLLYGSYHGLNIYPLTKRLTFLYFLETVSTAAVNHLCMVPRKRTAAACVMYSYL